jgi:hypothetical protein
MSLDLRSYVRVRGEFIGEVERSFVLIHEYSLVLIKFLSIERNERLIFDSMWLSDD